VSRDREVQVTAAAVESLSGSILGQAHALIADLVHNGAALGWVSPPPAGEVDQLLHAAAAASESGDGSLVLALRGSELLGFGYWLRYTRETHRPHVDIGRIAVSSAAQGQHLGRRLTVELLDTARRAGSEVVTLDVRADNVKAIALYESLGFTRFGLLPRFIAVGAARYDKIFFALDLRP
jgi:ribosomal protein S18 acetylase RimI-like enzyme